MTEQEARALIADLTTVEKLLLRELLLSLRPSPAEPSEETNRVKGEVADAH